MQYNTITFTRGLTGDGYQEIHKGNVLRLTDLDGNTLDDSNCEYAVTGTGNPAWGLPDPEAPVVNAGSVTPRQIRHALTIAGLREAVEAAMVGADQMTKDWWEYSTEFDRAHPLVAQWAVALGQTEEQVDQLWALAQSL